MTMAIISGENDGNKPKSFALRVTEGESFQNAMSRGFGHMLAGIRFSKCVILARFFSEPAHERRQSTALTLHSLFT